MQFAFFCPHWGQEHLTPEEFVARVRAAGYDGVEMVVNPDAAERARWQRLLLDHELLFIAQVLEAGQGRDFDAQLAETERYLRNAATLQPLKINSFTGRDYFSFEQNSALIRRTAEVGQALGIPVVHELHRGRFTYSAPALRPYLAAFPELRLNADFSHWCCVSESYLQAPELAWCVQQALAGPTTCTPAWATRRARRSATRERPSGPRHCKYTWRGGTSWWPCTSSGKPRSSPSRPSLGRCPTCRHCPTPGSRWRRNGT